PARRYAMFLLAALRDVSTRGATRRRGRRARGRRRRDQLAAVVERLQVVVLDGREHRLPRLEAARPTAAGAGGDAAQDARGADGDRDVDVTAAELGVDDGRGERERVGRRGLVRRSEVHVLRARADRERAGGSVDAEADDA